MLHAPFVNPLEVSFRVGALTRFTRSKLTVVEGVCAGLALFFLLFTVGLQGWHELSHADFTRLLGAARVAVLLGVLTPLGIERCGDYLSTM